MIDYELSWQALEHLKDRRVDWLDLLANRAQDSVVKTNRTL